MTELLKAKSEFRKRGVNLIADKQKTGGGGSWKFAGEDNLIKTIQQPLSDCGLEYIATMRAMPELNVNMVVGTLYHIESGESIESTKILETVEPKLSNAGNKLYLDAEIEAGKQFGYWSRILAMRLLGISDIDPEDINNKQQRLSKTYNTWSKANENEKLVYKNEFMEEVEVIGLNRDDIKDFFNFLNPSLNDIPSEQHNQIVHFLRQPDYITEQVEAYLNWKAKGN